MLCGAVIGRGGVGGAGWGGCGVWLGAWWTGGEWLGTMGARGWRGAGWVVCGQKWWKSVCLWVWCGAEGVVVGEVARDTNQVLYAYVNGDRATNKSPSTGVYVTNATSTYAESPVPTCGVLIDIGRFGSYHRNDLVSSGVTGSAAWIATALNNTPYGFRGVLNEVIVFNRKLQETERQEVYGYLSRKYSMDTKLPNSYTRSHPSAYALGLTYWNIEHHPNTKPLKGFYPGLCFGNIKLATFFEMPDFMYKSIGTIQSDHSLTVVDTYNSIGQ